MLSQQDLEQLEQRLCDVVCKTCIERDVRGNCTLWQLEQCPISLHLPRLIEVVKTVDSNLMEDYVARVRQDICSVCEAALSPTASCDVRNSGHCALDAYLSFVVETIEEFLSDKGEPVRT